MRSLAVAGMAAVSLSCADQSVGLKRGGFASLPIAPVFLTAPSGGPKIEISKIRGVLKRQNATDSSVAEASVEGDSAILEFEGVTVTGDSTKYELGVKAFDANNVVVFEGLDTVNVKPGDNAPAAPELEYTAPDVTVTSIEIHVGGEAASTTDLQWAGAAPGNTSCLNRAPSESAVTQVQLSVVGRNAAEQIVPNVRVGWTTLDSSVVTVDEFGLAKARCSNKFTDVVARTFLDKSATIKVTVTAPPFTLLMDPETAEVPRGDTKQMNAIVVDENGNATEATAVSWHASDTSRATVSGTGLVTGISNGRVVITASSGDRSTVGIVQVVRPVASRVVISPETDVLNTGQRRVYHAVAFDRNDASIPDASGFAWASTNPSIASVTSSGSVQGVSEGTAKIIVALDGKKDTANVTVTTSTTGAATGKMVQADGTTPIAGVSVTSQGTTSTSVTDGTFTTPQLTPPVTLDFSMTGYVSFSYFNAPFLLGQTVDLGRIPMAPVGGAGTISGIVVNALDDAAVSGADVKVFAGINAPDANPIVASGVTDANGNFTLPSVPAGTYTVFVGKSDFSRNQKSTVVVNAATSNVRVPLSPVLTGTNLRIVLSWGDCANVNVPCDLDSHLTGPASAPDTGRFHVAFFNDVYFSSPDTVAVLDNDAVDGLGPETITLRQKASGVYKYYVHNFSDGADGTSTRLSSSAQARVDVYQGANLVAVFFPPSGQPGTLWAVFQVEGTTITPVNQILDDQVFNDPPSDFMRIGGADANDVRRVLLDARQHRSKVLRPTRR
ncbi:MAG: Ig-like domain-containing protein [Gemmatimonadaceae bacterium]